MYLDLMKNQWTLPQIDEMDIHFFFELNERAEAQKNQPNAFIDDIPW
jgi:hypothetical protein